MRVGKTYLTMQEGFSEGVVDRRLRGESGEVLLKILCAAVGTDGRGLRTRLDTGCPVSFSLSCLSGISSTILYCQIRSPYRALT